MKITAVKIRKTFADEPLKAIVSVTVDDALAIHDIKIIRSVGEAGERLFAVMPHRREADGTLRDVVHPVTKEFRRALEDAVLTAYRAVGGQDGKN